MGQNPKVCLEVDEVANRSNWSSVIVDGTFVELKEPQFSAQKQPAIEKLGDYSLWWKTPLAQRRETVADLSVEPVFFCIDIVDMTGLRASADPSEWHKQKPNQTSVCFQMSKVRNHPGNAAPSLHSGLAFRKPSNLRGGK